MNYLVVHMPIDAYGRGPAIGEGFTPPITDTWEIWNTEFRVVAIYYSEAEAEKAAAELNQ
jgi:hypothetical protein